VEDERVFAETHAVLLGLVAEDRTDEITRDLCRPSGLPTG